MFRRNRDVVYSVWETPVEQWKRREWSITLNRFLSFYLTFNLEYNCLRLTRWQLQRCPSCLSQKLWLHFLLGLCVILVCFKIIITEYSNAPFHAPVPTHSPTNYKLQLITEPFYLASSYLAIIEWSWVGYEKFCKSRRVLSTDADCFIIHLKLFQV